MGFVRRLDCRVLLHYTVPVIVRTDTLSNAEFSEAYARAAAFWGIKTASSPGGETEEVTADMLRSRFATPPTNAEFHYVPSSFSLEQDFSFLPAAGDARWHALEQTLETVHPAASLSLLPSHLCMGTAFFETLRRTKSIGTTARVGNMPLAAEMMRQLGVELLIGTRKDISTFFSEADADTLLPLKAIHLVMEVSDVSAGGSYLVRTLRDLHVMPNVSVAWQCSTLSEIGVSIFHPSASFAWHTDDNLRITSLDDAPVPLFRFYVGRGEITQHVCACGEKSLLTIHGT